MLHDLVLMVSISFPHNIQNQSHGHFAGMQLHASCREKAARSLKIYSCIVWHVQHSAAQAAMAYLSTTTSPKADTQTLISKRLRTQNLLRSISAIIPRTIGELGSQELSCARVDVAVKDLGQAWLPTISG